VSREDADPAVTGIRDRYAQYFTTSGGDHAIVAHDASLNIPFCPIRLQCRLLDPSKVQFALSSTI
jgi:hypothetical protein